MCNTIQDQSVSDKTRQIPTTLKCRGECGEIKPISEFTKDKNAKYGVRNFCKKCVNAKRKGKKKKYPTEFEHPEEMFKQCKGPCGKVKDFNQFRKYSYSKDGRESICKECINGPKEPDIYIDGQLAKKCTGECGKVKILDEFNNDPKGKYGKKSKCKKCSEKIKKKYRQSPQGRATIKEYEQRPEVIERNRINRKSRRQTPEYKAKNSEYNKKYRKKPEVIAREKEKTEKNRRKGSGKFEILDLPELNWDKGNEMCPWVMDGKLFDIEQAKEDGILYILYVLLIRNGKNIIPDNSKYGGITNIITDEQKKYCGKSCDENLDTYLKENRKFIERHVLGVAKSKKEANELELDLLAHDDNTGIPRWKPKRTDWINRHPGGTLSEFEKFDISTITKKEIENFESKINKNGPIVVDSNLFPEINNTNCWEWTSSTGNTGYGFFGLKGKNMGAHRVSKMIYDKCEFEEEDCALHKCHNRLCVNPNHIYIGTKKQNADDTIKSGRRKILKGEDHPQSKLTWYKVREIRRKYATGNYTQERLGEIYDISQGYVGQIVRNKRRIE